MRLELAAALVATLCFAGLAKAADTSSSAATTAEIPADPARLRQLVLDLDKAMFEAYNAHDVPRLMSYFAPDIEFFHDTGGLAGFKEIESGFTSVFAGNKDIRRDLVPDSLEVYPIKDYGAIQTGRHRFCHTENGAADCGTFQFVQIWRLQDGVWKVTRELSFGH